MTTTTTKTPRILASDLPKEKPPVNVPAALRAYINYRFHQLENQRQAIQIKQAGGLGMGALMHHDQSASTIRQFLDELKSLATWLEAGQPVFTPPLSEDEKVQWRFARDHGGLVPEHILSQL